MPINSLSSVLQLFPKEKVHSHQQDAQQLRLGLVLAGLEVLAVQLEQQDQIFSVLAFCLN